MNFIKCVFFTTHMLKEKLVELINMFTPFFWTIISGLVGAIMALFIKKFEKPNLRISVGEEVNQDYVYSNANPPGRYKFFRVKVTNKKLPKILAWLLIRETAQQINAKVTFNQIKKTMKGRWAETLELPQANPFDYGKLANFPDPTTIFPGDSTILDLFVKYEKDNESYGWNNESYLNNWRTPKYKLNPGEYDIEVVLNGTNTQTRRVISAHIENTIDGTYLK